MEAQASLWDSSKPPAYGAPSLGPRGLHYRSCSAFVCSYHREISPLPWILSICVTIPDSDEPRRNHRILGVLGPKPPSAARHPQLPPWLGSAIFLQTVSLSLPPVTCCGPSQVQTRARWPWCFSNTLCFSHSELSPHWI